MNADKLLECLESMRKSDDNVEVVLLDPSQSVLSAIVECGGKTLGTHFDVWCHSDTCAHNSHDSGQSVTTVSVPKCWMLSENYPAYKASDIFDFNSDSESDTPLMVVPTESPTLVVESKSRHWAGHCFTAELRNSNKEC